MDTTATKTKKKVKINFNAPLMKNDLKKSVKEIRAKKKKRNDATSNVKRADLQKELKKLVYDHRCLNIAYCELRGLTRDQIEKPTKRAKKIDKNVIKRLKKKYVIK